MPETVDNRRNSIPRGVPDGLGEDADWDEGARDGQQKAAQEDQGRCTG
jgi:hypothetical protein